MRCGDDNLLVVRKPRDNQRIRGWENIRNRHFHPSDVVEINSLADMQSSNARLVEDMFRLLQSGVQIYIISENRYLGYDERRTMLYLLRNKCLCLNKPI